MDLFILFSVLVTMAALFSYLNVRFFGLPSGISLMLMGVLVALGIISLSQISTGFASMVRSELALINFSEFLLGILLSFLLFAGSLHVNLDDLKSSARSIIAFATLGTAISTFLIGGALYYVMDFFGHPFSLMVSLLFGALISPTDPIAVMGILKKADLPKTIQINIIGESLFNDGIGVVIFATLLKMSSVGTGHFGAADIALLFLQEAVGGIIAGWLIGFAGYRLMKSIDHFQTEILISLAMVMGGYTLCHFLHVSGPLAMVIAGIMTGNRGVQRAMSDTTKDYLGKFWEVTDEILNAILFMLIGLEMVVINFQFHYIWIGLITALLLVLSRFVSLYVPSAALGFRKGLGENTLAIMTWGGLRGGISLALALSLPAGAFKDVIVSVTFVIVLFSILVQGLTIERLIRHLAGK